MRAKPGHAELEGLHLDQSAGVYSLDVSMPIFGADGGPPLGVVKAVMGISPLFAPVHMFGVDPGASGEIVQDDGNVLLRLSSGGFQSARDTLSEKALRRLKPETPGWFVGEFAWRHPQHVGYAPVHLVGTYAPDGKISGPPFHVLVHQPADVVLAPLLQRFAILFLASTVGILLCAIIGTTLLRYNVLDPIQTLRRAAATMAATATRAFTNLPNRRQMADSHAALLKAASIRTGDEIEELAHDSRQWPSSSSTTRLTSSARSPRKPPKSSATWISRATSSTPSFLAPIRACPATAPMDRFRSTFTTSTRPPPRCAATSSMS